MKKVHIIIMIVLIVAVAIVIGTLNESGTYADFGTAKKNPKKSFQIIGKLETLKEIKYDSTVENQKLTFFLLDNKGKECQVVYYGNKPIDFGKLSEVVVTGKMDEDVFFAEEMLLKCPSKYTKTGSDISKYKSEK